MLLELTQTRQYLKDFDFRSLFLDMGWDRHAERVEVSVEGQTFTMTALAQKRGMIAFLCTPPFGRSLPSYNMRKKIERKLAKTIYEHLIIYTDAEKTFQVWQWAKRTVGRPIACSEHLYSVRQPGDSLIQKLQGITFSIEEEESITLFDVTSRARAAFDVEPVTKKFYERFKVEHAAFLKLLRGIPEINLQRWYASVLLNRLMFLYFLQKKGFLAGNTDYLRSKLTESMQEGKDHFYRTFLCLLFFEGVAKKKVDRSLHAQSLLGKVPHLSGSLFVSHRVEELYGQDIHIADAAFARLFDFFDAYQWHLDERPLRADNEINPDVLGYIYEKYINQREMGAYYTKEDITGHLAKNTIIPFLFDVAEKECAIALRADGAVWRLLRDDPHRYIHQEMCKGVTLPLPSEIAGGIDDVHKRIEWDKQALEVYALPNESWREVVARRQRYEDTRRKMGEGEITHIHDLITYNLDIHQFIQDVIEDCEGPELLRAFYDALEKLSVLDPTCGSGAFLFTALNILEPLYEACLDRMEAFVDELSLSRRRHHVETFSDFRHILNRVKEHPNRRSFVLKSIILNNLYGVDIMEEASEICKFRLYLKLMAQVERDDDIEPLPDIDFNIRAGNTLVGFASYVELEKALSSTFDFDNTLERLQKEAKKVDRAYQKFRDMQTEQDVESEALERAKSELRQGLAVLATELDHYLADGYRMNMSKDGHAFDVWHRNHHPFHWFVEFYGIMTRGGFDVIIGNPPYVEYRKVKSEYTLPKATYTTESCGNLYAFVIERNEMLLSPRGRSGMIVPHSAFCTDRMAPVLKLIQKHSSWISTYSIRPAKLFVGVDQRLAVYTLGGRETRSHYSTKYYCWNEEFRPFLFPNLQYTSVRGYTFENAYPKVSTRLEESIWRKVHAFRPLSFSLSGDTVLYYHNAPRYWIRAMTFAPYFWNERGGEQVSSHLKTLHLANTRDAAVTAAALNSSLFFWWFILLSNCRDLTMREIEHFPLEIAAMIPAHREALIVTLERLMEDYRKHAVRKEAQYKATGKVVYDEYYPKHSKPLMDEIDQVLAQHYGFTEEELDFIVHYEIKYRMGKELEGDAEE